MFNLRVIVLSLGASNLLYDSRSDEVNLFRADNNKHDSDNLANLWKLKNLLELFKLKAKPKRIKDVISGRGITPIPSDVQLRNHLVKIRKEFYGPATISLSEL